LQASIIVIRNRDNRALAYTEFMTTTMRAQDYTSP